MRARGLVPAALPVGDGPTEVGVEAVMARSTDQNRASLGGGQAALMGGIGGLGGEGDCEAEAGRHRDRQTGNAVHATETSRRPADLRLRQQILVNSIAYPY